MKFYIGQQFTNTYPPEAALWCNSNSAYIEEVEPNIFKILAIPEATPEEIAQAELQEAKAERAETVANIKVSVDGMLFDGDEDSQTRMSRSIVALDDNERILWVLADNTPTMVTKEQLKKALRLAGEAQTRVWADPYKEVANG